MKNIVNIVLLSIFATLLVVALALGICGSHKHASESKCMGIRVELSDSALTQFISPEMVRRLIDKEYGGYKNVPMGSISLSKIEKILQSEGLLDQHEAYFTPDGWLNIKARQCQPALKLKTEDGMYYICHGGKYFKVGDDWCKDIPLMRGKLQQDALWLKRVCEMGRMLDRNESGGELERLSCDSHGEVSMKFKEGNEIFYFGQPVNLDKKFKKIATYRDKILPTLEEGKTYKSVNLKYENQIVCR